MEDTCSVQESLLCDKCSVLRIDDREQGGHQAQNDAGEPILKFNNSDEVFRELWLDYVHHDSLPDLPYLKASAEAGCAFCATLRSAALELGFAKSAQVTFNLRYLWYPHTKPQYGLCTLVANWQSEHIDFKTFATFPFVFNVSCEEGDSQLDVPEVYTDCTRQVPEMAQNSTPSTDRNVR